MTTHPLCAAQAIEWLSVWFIPYIACNGMYIHWNLRWFTVNQSAGWMYQCISTCIFKPNKGSSHIMATTVNICLMILTWMYSGLPKYSEWAASPLASVPYYFAPSAATEVGLTLTFGVDHQRLSVSKATSTCKATLSSSCGKVRVWLPVLVDFKISPGRAVRFCLKIKSLFISLKTRFSITISISLGVKGIHFFFIKRLQTN